VSVYTSVAISEVYGKGKGKMLQDKIQGLQVFYSMLICLKFKIHLKFRNNKKLLFYNCEFPQGLTINQYLNLKLMSGKNKMYHGKRTAHRYGVTSLWLNHLSSASSTSLCSVFRNLISRDPFCSNALIILVLFFQIVWVV